MIHSYFIQTSIIKRLSRVVEIIRLVG